MSTTSIPQFQPYSRSVSIPKIEGIPQLDLASLVHDMQPELDQINHSSSRYDEFTLGIFFDLPMPNIGDEFDPDKANIDPRRYNVNIGRTPLHHVGLRKAIFWDDEFSNFIKHAEEREQFLGLREKSQVNAVIYRNVARTIDNYTNNLSVAFNNFSRYGGNSEIRRDRSRSSATYLVEKEFSLEDYVSVMECYHNTAKSNRRVIAANIMQQKMDETIKFMTEAKFEGNDIKNLINAYSQIANRYDFPDDLPDAVVSTIRALHKVHSRIDDGIRIMEVLMSSSTPNRYSSNPVNPDRRASYLNELATTTLGIIKHIEQRRYGVTDIVGTIQRAAIDMLRDIGVSSHDLYEYLSSKPLR